MPGGKCAVNSMYPLDRVGRQGDAFGAADIDRFAAGGKENRTQVGIVAQPADRLARQRHDAGVAGEQDELHPELGEDLFAQRRIETGFQAQREKILGRACCACRRARRRSCA